MTAARAPIIIIGAGVGGLAAAVRLAAAGRRVMVIERAAQPGGKMRQVEVGGVPFDAGPSVLTMPWVFDELFAAAGQQREDWVRFIPIEPACRHFFADGAVLDLWSDDRDASEPWARSAAEVERIIGPRAAEEFCRYRRHAADLYRAVERPFLRRPLPRTPFGLLFSHDAGDARGLLRLDARRTVYQALGRFFSGEHLRVLFSRYATYCGSDPFRAPATLNVIPHVELGFGIYTVAGGMAELSRTLARLATSLGAEIQYGAEVERIELDSTGRRATAVVLAGNARLPAEAVVANCDVAQLYHRLLVGASALSRRKRKVDGLEPSLSAHLRLILADAVDGLPFALHNVFFSADYAREFAELRGGLPSDPTVYLCSSPATLPGGGDGARWFFLLNAPPLGADPADDGGARGAAEAPIVRARIADKLLLSGVTLDRHALAEAAIVPADFAARYPHSRGAIYGSASNRRLSAFSRPRNQLPGVDNIYCVGGSTHPGAGVPMVALSAQLSCELLLSKLR